MRFKYKAYNNGYKILVGFGLTAIWSTVIGYVTTSMKTAGTFYEPNTKAYGTIFVVGVVFYVLGKIMNKKKAVSDFGKVLTEKTGKELDTSHQLTIAYVTKKIEQLQLEKETFMAENVHVHMDYQEEAYTMMLLTKLYAALDNHPEKINVVELKTLQMRIKAIKSNIEKGKYKEIPETVAQWKEILTVHTDTQRAQRLEETLTRLLDGLAYQDIKADTMFADTFLTCALKNTFMQQLFYDIYD